MSVILWDRRLWDQLWDQLSGIGAVPTVACIGVRHGSHRDYRWALCSPPWSLRRDRMFRVALVCDVIGAQVAFLTAASLISWTLQQSNAHIFVAVYSSIDIGYRCVTSWS